MTKLKIIATPIGNVRDISLRALDEISHAQVILAEDTRHTKKLIDALGIHLSDGARLISCHSHNEAERFNVVKAHLEQNHRVVLVTDAGCPTVSDPGSLLVQSVIEAGYEVEIIPGASALTAALMGAGLDTTRHVFLGFLPQKKSARLRMVKDAAGTGYALVIFESPLRVKKLLLELHEFLGERRVVVARELTKIYECFHRGILGADLCPPVVEKGEMVVIVEGQKPDIPLASDEEITKFIARQVSEGLKAKAISRLVADQFKIKSSEAYERVVKACRDPAVKPAAGRHE